MTIQEALHHMIINKSMKDVNVKVDDTPVSQINDYMTREGYAWVLRRDKIYSYVHPSNKPSLSYNPNTHTLTRNGR